jgi:murein L,D-transpeptidase YafK
MTDAKMAELKKHKWYSFWKTLKEGYDHFEKHRLPPGIVVCERRYLVNAYAHQSRPDPAGPCPPISRPQIAAFTPLPEAAEPSVAAGTKMKGISDSDNDPTLAEIKAAKAVQATVTTGAAPASGGLMPSAAAATGQQ